MNFKEKVKKLRDKILGDLGSLSWKDFDHKKVYGAAAVLLALIILVVVLVAQSFSGKGDDKGKSVKEDSEKNKTEAVQEEEPVEENPLEVDAYEAVNEVIRKYFEGLSSGNIDLVRQVVDVLTDEEAKTIETKKEYVESYQNITCYTKKGLEEGSYVVFAAYEMKILGIETSAPGMMPLYVCTAEDGSLYIFNDEAPETLENYVLELASEEELAGIIAEIQTRYEEALVQDADLAEFDAKIHESQQEEPPVEEPQTEEPPAEEPQQEEPPAEEPQQEEPPAEEPQTEEPPVEEQPSEELAEPYRTTVSTTIRIRKERSADSEMLATLAADTGVTVYAHYSDGWSKIEYDGTVGYCKTEYLRPQGSDPVSSGSASSLNKKMRLKSTVRIRKERSADSSRIATGYQGEYVQAIESYGDGWSKVEYNGKTGYCQTKYLEDV